MVLKIRTVGITIPVRGSQTFQAQGKTHKWAATLLGSCKAGAGGLPEPVSHFKGDLLDSCLALAFIKPQPTAMPQRRCEWEGREAHAHPGSQELPDLHTGQDGVENAA